MPIKGQLNKNIGWMFKELYIIAYIGKFSPYILVKFLSLGNNLIFRKL